MTEPVPPDGISAFFDEELSPSEVTEVAHHLSRSPAAQSELADIRRLSEELRSLPRESAPRFLLPGVMNHVDEKSTPSKPVRGESRKFGRTVSLLFAAGLALTLCIAWLPTLWNGSNSADPDSTVAAHEPTEQELDHIGKAAQSASVGESKKEVPQASPFESEGELLSQGNKPKALGDAQEFSRGAAINRQPGFDQLSPPAPPSQMGIEAAALPKPRTEADKFNVADPQVQQLLESASGAENRVLIVELTAQDAEGTLKNLQTLLAQGSVEPASLGRDSTSTEEKQKKQGDSQLALFVQSTPEQLAEALEKLRAQSPGSHVNALRPMAASDVLLTESEENELAAKDQAGQSAHRSLAQVLAKLESGQVSLGKGGKAPDGSAARFRAGGNANDRPTRAMKTPERPAKNPAAAPQESNAFMLPGNAPADEKGPVEWKSFQIVLETSRESWRKKAEDQAEAAAMKVQSSGLQTQRADSLSDQIAPSAEAAPKETATLKANAAPKPIRTLFFFRTSPKATTK